MSDTGKGVSWKAAGMLVSGFCALLLLLWHSGIVLQIAHTCCSNAGRDTCSVGEGALWGTRASCSMASNGTNAAPAKKPRAIIYAHGCCNKTREIACQSALQHGFESCGQFGLDDLELSALSPSGYSILTEKGSPGAGYWLWKPLIILQELIRAQEGDILVYMDADSEIMSDIMPWLRLLDDQDVVGFASAETEELATKLDVLKLLNATELSNTKQLYAGLIFLRRSWQSIGLVSQWLAYCQDRRWMTGEPSGIVPPGQRLPGYQFHRADQALFSLTYKNWGLRVYPDRFSFNARDRVPPYPTLWMFHHNGKD